MIDPNKNIDDYIHSPELELAMVQVNQLRHHEDNKWYQIWESINEEVFNKQQQAVQLLKHLGITKVGIHCGFVREIEISAIDFVYNHKEIFKLIPKLCFLRVENYTKVGRSFFEIPDLINISALDLSENRLRDEDISDLSKCFFAQNLCWLDISNNLLSNLAAEMIADSQYLYGLCYLNLEFNYCDDVQSEIIIDELTGQVVDSNPSMFGIELEKKSKRGWLPWLHAYKTFRHLYPPRMSDTLCFSSVILEDHENDC